MKISSFILSALIAALAIYDVTCEAKSSKPLLIRSPPIVRPHPPIVRPPPPSPKPDKCAIRCPFTFIYAPVCGLDLLTFQLATYSSACALKVAACEGKIYLIELFPGECPKWAVQPPEPCLRTYV